RGVDNDWKSLVIKIMSREMQELEKEFKVFVIGVANDVNKLPATFRNRELFQSNLTVTAPARRSREEILRIHLSKLKFGDQTEVNDFVKRLSQRTSGFVGRDLMRLCRSAALHSLRRCEKQKQKQDCDIADLLAKLSMSESSISDSRELVWEDFEYALGIVKPSEKIVFESSIPTRRWDEIGGYEAVKRRVHQILDWPLSHPETYEKLGIKPPAGLLLHGPSGCGKTVLVQAAATTLSANSITIKGPELFSKYLGETEAAIRRLFATAKQIAPCLIFFDEIDSITSKREWDNDGTSGVNERVLSTLLNEMDGIQERKDVLIVGCTNRPDQIDDALLRPGRLDQLLYVGLPSLDDRESIIRVISRHIPLDVDVDIKSLAARTDAFTGAELELLFRESSILALREDIGIQQVSYKHVEPVLLRMKKTVMERNSTDERTLDLSVARQ
ncbi:9091_t:CDS:2, partial [Paraglomus occultum]